MSMFFRSALWRHGPFLDLRLPQTQASPLRHLFSSSKQPLKWQTRTFAQAAKPIRAAKPAPSKPSRPPSARPLKDYLPPSTSYARLLASRGSPTMLYQAPQTIRYPLGCVLVGTFAIAYGLYNFYDSFLIPHPGLVWFVPWLMVFVCVFTFGVGVYVLRNGTSLVRTVTAVPTPGGPLGPLTMRVELRSLVGRRRVVERPLEHVKVDATMAEARAEGLVGRGEEELERYPATDAGRRAAQVAKRQADRERYREGLKNPFTHLGGNIGKVFSRLTRGIRRVVAREGFTELKIKQPNSDRWRSWRMDVAEGFLLDGGGALERLLR